MAKSSFYIHASGVIWRETVEIFTELWYNQKSTIYNVQPLPKGIADCAKNSADCDLTQGRESLYNKIIIKVRRQQIHLPRRRKRAASFGKAVELFTDLWYNKIQPNERW